MLAPILQHGDDIDFVRCLFLNSNLEDSLRLINPPLYLARRDRVLRTADHFNKRHNQRNVS